MKRDNLLLIIMGISLINTAYVIFLALIIYTTGVTLFNGLQRAVQEFPFTIIPILTAGLGWLATVYEIFSLKNKEVLKTLRKNLSGKSDDWVLYNAFKGRGGPRRLSIMESLGKPKLRNEIAQLTGTDWKEVDRNIRVLESIDLVRIQYNHGKVSVYELTDKGKEFLNLVETEIKR